MGRRAVSRFALGAAAALAAVLPACELTEVAAPASEDVLVVEAVMRAGATSQFVILHRTVEGRVVRGEPGASVEVTDRAGQSIRYSEAPIERCILGPAESWGIEGLELRASCYVTDPADGFVVEPGMTYQLQVVTTKGERASGQTTVPAAFAFTSPNLPIAPGQYEVWCRLPSVPFTLAWERSEGAWAYVVTMHLFDWADELRAQGVEVPEPVELTSVSVSAADTTLLFPTNIGLFQRGELDRRIFEALGQGVPADARVALVVLAADRNYTNSIRGGRFNPSGNVRLSSIVGDGVGVFGSVIPLLIRSAPDGRPLCPDPLPAGAAGNQVSLTERAPPGIHQKNTQNAEKDKGGVDLSWF